MFTALLISGLALLLLKHKQRVEGIGRVKRRIYKEVSLAQNAGVDFSKKFTELTNDEIKALEQLGEEMTWKQSPRSAAAGKSYAESYYNSLRRAWNAVSGVSGIGAAYNVKDANGKVVLTWIEDAAEHYAAEERLNQMEAELRKKRNSIRRRRNAPLPAPVVEPEPENDPAPKIAPETPKTKRVKPTSKKQRIYDERWMFAKDFLDGYMDEASAYGDKSVSERLLSPILESAAEHHNLPKSTTVADVVIEEFAKGSLKVKGSGDFFDAQIYAGGEWGQADSRLFNIVKDLLQAWKDKGLREGFADENLNEKRRALLDKAKHMVVIVNGERITGEDRYNYLDDINYVLMSRYTITNGNTGEKDVTIYPMFAAHTAEEAEVFKGRSQGYKERGSNLTDTHTYKVVPIFEVDIEAISGIIGK